MAWLDKLLELFGTNRTRMQWRLRAWRRGWDKRVGSVKNRAQAVTYAHQTCPKCSHPAGADEKQCSRCGEPLGGVAAQRARRMFALVWGASTPVVPTVLIAAIVGMYATTAVWDSKVGLSHGIHMSPSSASLYRFGSLFSPAIEAGEWWRVSTSTFLHGGLLHLIFNVTSLWTVAVFLEDVLGAKKTLALYLALGACASLASLAWHTQLGPGVANSVGASGAICGLIGVAIGFAVRKRNAARHERGRYVWWAVWIVILGFSGWRIDNAAHLGGLVAGFAAGLVVKRKGEGGRWVRHAWTVALVALVGGTIASAYLMLATPMPAEQLAYARAQLVPEEEIYSSRQVLRRAAKLPSDPEVQAAIAGARRDAEAAFEPLPASAAPAIDPVSDRPADFALWAQFHPQGDLYAAWSPDFIGCMIRVFGAPADHVWVLRHRATGVIAVARDTSSAGWVLTGPAGRTAEVGAALAALIDRVPPADFQMIFEDDDYGLERIGAVDGTAYAEPVAVDEQLAYYDQQIAAATSPVDRAAIEIRALTGAVMAPPEEAAEHHAGVLRYLYDAVEVTEHLEDQRTAESYAGILDAYARTVAIPDDIRARIAALAQRYPHPGP